MEDTPREVLWRFMGDYQVVLILVLMEDTLRGQSTSVFHPHFCLNPCFNGRYSQSSSDATYRIANDVLILVLMEDTLRVAKTS